MKLLSTFVLVVFLSFSFGSAAPAEARTKTGYEKSTKPLQGGPVLLGDDAELEYSIYESANKASFSLRIRNSTALSAENERAWVVFGFGEPASGGYLGADIVTIEFGAHPNPDKTVRLRSKISCQIVDRYIPFSAFPLEEGVAGAPQFQVKEDKCQNNSWHLDACSWNINLGTIRISVKRPLSAFDMQDREITSGTQQILWAYGTGVEVLTSGVRRSRHLALFDVGSKLPKADPLGLPEDAWGNQTILANFKVPASPVTYACTSLEAEARYGSFSTLVAFDPILQATKGPLAAKSMILYACPYFAQFPFMTRTRECGVGLTRRPSAYCHEVLYRWSNGITRFLLPDDVGFKVNIDNKFFVLETRYENPDGIEGLIDNSGVRFHYVKQDRKNVAGSLVLGDVMNSLNDFSISKEFGNQVSLTCPTSCTKNFKQAIQVFASSPEMSFYGRSIKTLKHSSTSNGSKYLETVQELNFWSKKEQWTYFLSKPIQLEPGQQLSTTCKYDTRKRPDAKFGRYSFQGESCLNYIFYYPKQDLSVSVGYPTLDGKLGHCGLSKRIDNGTYCGPNYLETANIPLNSTGEGENNFGLKPDVCYSSNLVDQRSSNESKKAKCFPSDARVTLQDGRTVALSELKLGDTVASGDGKYSEVFAFTHRSFSGSHDFISIRTERNIIELSPTHYLYVNETLVAAKDVVIGDFVLDRNGTSLEVVDISCVTKEGLFSPQTFDGNIVVNGVKASCYTTTISPAIAHAQLSIFRMMASNLRVYLLSLVDGIHSTSLRHLI